MTEHLTPAERQAFAARTLSARTLLRFDRHLAQCDACAQEMARMASLRSALGIVHQVERAGPHLTYEQLEALVDARAPAHEGALRGHLSSCTACTRELTEMQGYAAKLSAPVVRRTPALSLAGRLSAWFGGPAALGAATAALAVAVAVTAVWQSGVLDPAADDSVRSAMVGAAPVARDAYDRSVLDDLATMSGPAHAAYMKQDYAALASVLLPLANTGDARAQAALGLLYAEGHGVAANPIEAERWLALAAERNAAARHNLAVLRAKQAPNAK